MLNDVKPPPEPTPEPSAGGSPSGPASEARPHNPAVKPHEHIHPHVDSKEPGTHHARIMGEKTPTDAIYAMPMEDRGSTFSVTLSIVVTLLLLVVWLSIR